MFDRFFLCWSVLLVLFEMSWQRLVYHDKSSVWLKSWEKIHFFTSYEGGMSDYWKVCDGVRQSGFPSGFLFIFYLNKISRDVSNLPRGSELNGNEIKLFLMCRWYCIPDPSKKCVTLYGWCICYKIINFNP